MMLTALRTDLRNKQRSYDVRLQQMPQIEREYRDLTRDYDSAKDRYREIKMKQSQAEIAREFEKDRKAERFAPGEPASFPEKPIRPNRPSILLSGLVASVLAGLVFGWLRESLDPSVKGPRELARVATIPILSAIPYIETQRERLKLKRRRTLVILMYATLLIALILLIHFFVKPIPDIMLTLTRRIGL